MFASRSVTKERERGREGEEVWKSVSNVYQRG